MIAFRLLLLVPAHKEVRSYLCKHGRKPVREYFHVLDRVPDENDVSDLLLQGQRYFDEIAPDAA